MIEWFKIELDQCSNAGMLAARYGADEKNSHWRYFKTTKHQSAWTNGFNKQASIMLQEARNEVLNRVSESGDSNGC